VEARPLYLASGPCGHWWIGATAYTSNSEKRLFRRLGVFAGGWTLPQYVAVCSGAGGNDSSSEEQELHLEGMKFWML